MLYRLIKQTGEITKYTKKKMWVHLKYYFPLTPEFRHEVCEQLYMGGVIDTPLYKISQGREALGRKD